MTSAPPPRVTACVVSFNNADTLKKCLANLLSQTGVELDVVVFDNASIDESAAIASEFENVKLIVSKQNIGFAAGANEAFAHCDGPYALFCNPDVFLHPGCLSACVKALEKSDANIAAAQPKLVQSGKDDQGRSRLDSTGILLSLSNLSPRDRGRGKIDEGQYDGATEIFGPTAACALWRVEALRKCMIGGELFDEDFFAYYEDVDLAWRANNQGFRFLFVPEARAAHDRKDPPFHGTRIDAIAFANRYLLLLKNAHATQIALTLLKTFWWELPRWIYKSLTQPGFSAAWKQLFWKLPKMLKKRKLIGS